MARTKTRRKKRVLTKRKKYRTRGGSKEEEERLKKEKEAAEPKKKDKTQPDNSEEEDDETDKSYEREPDRRQDIDYMFYNPTLEPNNGFVKYIVVNQPPHYSTIFDNFSYQFMGVNELLHALSQNKPLIPDYVIHKTIETNRARSKDEIDFENDLIEKKENTLEEKLKRVKALKRRI